MSLSIFLLLIAVCLGLIYMVHKYSGKEQFYMLGIIYSVISFLLSFKLINIFGVDINTGLIFSSGILVMLYYFVNRYSEKESRRYILSISGVSLLCLAFFLLLVLMEPSVYDKMSSFYEILILDNLSIAVLYPISLIVTLFLGEYCFKEVKKEESKKLLKLILVVCGLIFIESLIFIYFGYAFVIRFDTAMKIAIDNYLIKVGIMTIYVLIVNRLFMVRKVK